MKNVTEMTTLYLMRLWPTEEERMVLNNVPNRAVECCDTKDIPLVRDPAPQSGVTVHPQAVLVGDEDIRQGWDEGDPVADDEIPDFHPLQAHGVEFEIEG